MLHRTFLEEQLCLISFIPFVILMMCLMLLSEILKVYYLTAKVISLMQIINIILKCSREHQIL
ncbi:hypothetical protein Y788_17445 [Pantoea dispersa 625]|nr:hypothetical protein Y788_17445 [Pantoea dispersa 625]